MIGLKKIILAICLVFLLGFSVTALQLDKITPSEDFIVYSSAPEKVAEVLNCDPQSLANKVAEQNIKFLAVTEDCSKQIQAVETETDFASSVKNLSICRTVALKHFYPILRVFLISREKLFQKTVKNTLELTLKTKMRTIY